MISADLPKQVQSNLRADRQRKPEGANAGRIQAGESLGRNADNRYRNIVQPNSFPDCGGIATEGTLPVAVRKNRNGWCTRRVVGGTERPPKGSSDTERVKIISRN